LAAFASHLHRYRDVPVKIVALHHSPNIPEPGTEEGRNLPPIGTLGRLTMQMAQEQRQALRLLCIAHRVRLVLHGHLHRTEARRLGGIEMVGAPAATEPTPANGKPPTYAFWRYAIAGPSARVTRRLVTIV
jgi:3',5'-cyclic AMP phosphodiesterase CpdA